MQIVRIVPNVSSTLFEASYDFYVELVDLVVSVDLADWYLQLTPATDQSLNIGFLPPATSSSLIARQSLARYPLVLTLNVDDVEEAYARAQRIGAEILFTFATRTTVSATLWWSIPTGCSSTS